jgi:hypothetical protein
VIISVGDLIRARCSIYQDWISGLASGENALDNIEVRCV